MFIERNFTGGQNSAEKSCTLYDCRLKCTSKILAKIKLNNALIVTLFDSILTLMEIFTKPGSKYSETVKLYMQLIFFAALCLEY
jgi:hypothetical protein